MSGKKQYASRAAGYEGEGPVVVLLPGSFRSQPFRLSQPARYYSRVLDRWIVIEAGFRSDMLSVPWAFRRVLPRAEWGKRAAIVHDWLCVHQPDWCTGLQAADVFAECLAVDGVPRWRRRLMYWAVAAFGPHWP